MTNPPEARISGAPSHGAATAVALFIAMGLALSAMPSAQAQTLTTLYTFCSYTDVNTGLCEDGTFPYAGLVQGSNGIFYGTTYAGGRDADGAGGVGTVFVYDPITHYTNTLYVFCSVSFKGLPCIDGEYPQAGLVQGSNGYFYGTTSSGGGVTNASCTTADNTCGTVFLITPSGTQAAIYAFCSGSTCTDGWYPVAGLVQGSDGNFYGTTEYGGANNTSSGGDGTVFSITPSGILTTLYSFCSESSATLNCTDGAYPRAAVIQGSDGNFYGTTANGGANGEGTVFKITPSGTLTTLYSFCSQAYCPDGVVPVAGLVQGSDGNFYGTTALGGPGVSEGGFGAGTVFKITPSGTLTTLYNFCSETNCTDGEVPVAGLVQASDGNFYGTTEYGGANGISSGGYGTIFRLTPSGMLTTLYSFCSNSYSFAGFTICYDGTTPLAGLFQGSAGSFYGTTEYGGGIGSGTSFTLTVTPFAALSPTSLSFSRLPMDTRSAPQTVILSNSSSEALAITDIAISGVNASDFFQSNDCPGLLDAGASCTIHVSFRPTDSGTRNGALTITDNEAGVAGSTQTVPLSGIGARIVNWPGPIRLPWSPSEPEPPHLEPY